MNSKTAKLITKFANLSSRNPELVKKLWDRTPKRMRREFRQAMQEVLAAL